MTAMRVLALLLAGSLAGACGWERDNKHDPGTEGSIVNTVHVSFIGTWKWTADDTGSRNSFRKDGTGTFRAAMKPTEFCDADFTWELLDVQSEKQFKVRSFFKEEGCGTMAATQEEFVVNGRRSTSPLTYETDTGQTIIKCSDNPDDWSAACK